MNYETSHFGRNPFALYFNFRRTLLQIRNIGTFRSDQLKTTYLSTLPLFRCSNYSSYTLHATENEIYTLYMECFIMIYMQSRQSSRLNALLTVYLEST